MNTFSQIIIWAVLILTALGSILSVGRVGKPRQPLKADEAAAAVFVNLCVIVGLLFVIWSNR